MSDAMRFDANDERCLTRDMTGSVVGYKFKSGTPIPSRNPPAYQPGDPIELPGDGWKIEYKPTSGAVCKIVYGTNDYLATTHQGRKLEEGTFAKPVTGVDRAKLHQYLLDKWGSK